MAKEEYRIVWVDYAKAIAITLVVVFHSGFITSKITAPLLAMGVPLFFLINGSLVLNKERSVGYYLKKMAKIIFLIFFWAGLSSLTTMWLRNEPIHLSVLIHYVFDLRMGYCHIFWFLCTLLALYAIYPCIQRSISCNKNILYYLLAITFLLSFRLFGYRIPLSAHIPNLFVGWQSEAFFYSLCGYLTISRPLQIKRNVLIAMLSLFLALYCLQLSMFSNIHICNDLLIRHTPNDVDTAVFTLYGSPFVMFMTVILVVLLKNIKLQRNNFVTFIGGNTLGIYCIHSLIMRVFGHILPSIAPFVDKLALFLIGFLGSMVVCFLFSKNRVSRFLITM